MPHQPGGKDLGHLIFVGKIIGDAADDVPEHDAHQGDHHHVLKLDALNEPDENPRAQNGAHKGEQRPAPNGGGGHEQQRQQDPELSGGDGCSGGGRDKFVHAKLLHDEPRHAHPHPRAKDCQ